MIGDVIVYHLKYENYSRKQCDGGSHASQESFPFVPRFNKTTGNARYSIERDEIIWKEEWNENDNLH